MTFSRHLARHMKGEAMDMITIHTTVLGTTPPQHLVFCMEAQAIATIIVHTTLLGMILTHKFGMMHEGQNYGYDYGLHNTASNIPPSTFGFALE